MPSPLADSLPLLAPSAPRLVGIARLAALGESITIPPLPGEGKSATRS